MKIERRKGWDFSVPQVVLTIYNSFIIKYIVRFIKSCVNNLLLHWMLFLIIISIVWGICKMKEWMNNFCCYPISYIIVTGKRHYTTNYDINKVILKLGNLGTFLTQDVNVIQKQIEYLSWIKQVSVRKKWPDTLKIHIVEHIPLACWNDSQIISTTGTIFNITQKEQYQNDNIKSIPILYGPEGSAQIVLTNYYVFNELLTKSNKLQVKSVKMDARCSWQLLLQNNIYLKLGRNNIIKRIYYFIKIYPFLQQKISEKKKCIDYVDLRYYTGFAVKWASDNSITSVFYNRKDNNY